MNKNFILALFSIFFLGMASYFFYQHEGLKKENLTLKLKMKLYSSDKRKAISLRSLKKNSPGHKKDIIHKKNINSELEKLDQLKKTSSQASISKNDGILLNNLEDSLKELRKLDPRKIDENLELVDELISRNPNAYSMYKAKLILLLTKEAQNNNVNEDQIEDLLYTMSSFDVEQDQVLRKEAFLIARSNQNIDLVNEEIFALEEDYTNAESVDERDKIEQELAVKYLELDDLEENLELGLAESTDYLNEDIVEIPLYRSLAKGDYDTVIEESESLLEEYPNTISGHFFLIRALELSNRNDEVNEYIESLSLSTDQVTLLQRKLANARRTKAKDYWRQLRF